MTAFDFMEGDSDYRAAAEAKATPERKTAAEALAAQPAAQLIAAAVVDEVEVQHRVTHDRLIRMTAAYDALVAAIDELANDTTETEYLRLRARTLLDKHLKEYS